MRKLKMACAMLLSTIMIATQGVNVYAAYDGEEAAEYAIEHAEEDSYNTYYDSYSNDCTNFVSQCLHAGGLSKTSYSNKDFGINDETSGWYHVRYTRWNTIFGVKFNVRTDWKVSTTWIRVYNTGSGKGLYQYLTNTKGYTVITASSIDDVIKYAEIGDVIQCAYNGENKSHSAIVTSVRTKDIGVSYHTNDRKDVSFKNSLGKSYDKFYIIKVK